MRLLFILLFPLCWAKCPSDTVCDQTFKKCYKYVDEGQPYFAAEEDCVSLGGHLTSIENTFENAFIGETADSMFNGYSDYWIGAYQDQKWSWTDKTPWSYTDWFPGEPADEIAASVFLRSYSWTTSDPASSKPYVCELPLSSSRTTVSKHSATAPAPTSAACPTPAHIYHCESAWTYFAGTQSCYKVFFNQSFNEAEEVCKRAGSHLTSIHSHEENDFVSDLASMGRPVHQSDTTWIGMYRARDEWMWVDGSENTYTAWGAWTEPGNCALVYASGWVGGGWVGQWQPDYCSNVHRNFVCKKPSL